MYNEKLIGVEISPNVWYITDKTLEGAYEEGVCCKNVYCDLHDFIKVETECEKCIFGEGQVLDLENINYKIL